MRKRTPLKETKARRAPLRLGTRGFPYGNIGSLLGVLRSDRSIDIVRAIEMQVKGEHNRRLVALMLARLALIDEHWRETRLGTRIRPLSGDLRAKRADLLEALQAAYGDILGDVANAAATMRYDQLELGFAAHVEQEEMRKKVVRAFVHLAVGFGLEVSDGLLRNSRTGTQPARPRGSRKQEAAPVSAVPLIEIVEEQLVDNTVVSRKTTRVYDPGIAEVLVRQIEFQRKPPARDDEASR